MYDKIYKVLSEPRRRRILSALQGNVFSVQELQSILMLGQSIISAHLANLKFNNLVLARRQGKYILYCLNTNDRAYKEILDALFSIAAREEWYERDQKMIQKILQRKKESSLSFYESLEYQNKRSPGQTDHSLAIALMRSIRGKRIIDIGCGAGMLAKEFSRRNSVLGIDINEKQVRIAKKLHAREIKEKRLDFSVASAEKLHLKDSSVDIILFSHSLHHIERTTLALKECYRVLSKKGLLIILDLSTHSEMWLKEGLGDVHLGFESSKIKDWLETAGFTHIYIDTDASDDEYPDFETLIVTAEKNI